MAVLMGAMMRIPESLRGGTTRGRFTEEDMLNQQLERLLTARYGRRVSGPEAGAYAGSFGPTREKRVSPEDLQMAMGLMQMMEDKKNREFEVKRQQAALDFLRPPGGGEMTFGGETEPVESKPQEIDERARWMLGGAGYQNPDPYGSVAATKMATMAGDPSKQASADEKTRKVVLDLQAKETELMEMFRELQAKMKMMSPGETHRAMGTLQQIKKRLEYVQNQKKIVMSRSPGSNKTLQFDSQGNLVR